jgi:hypothetical protein
MKKKTPSKNGKPRWTVKWLPEKGGETRRHFTSERPARAFYRKLYLRPYPPLEQSIKAPEAPTS